MQRLTIIAVFLFTVLIGNSTMTNAASHTYVDVPETHNNYADVTYLLERGIISKSTTYGINDIMTREDVAVLIAKALQLDGTQRATKFSDVPQSHPNSGYIQSAVEAGIINGYDDGTFKPKANITRGHMATFIARAFTLPSGTQKFTDVPKGHTAYEAVQQLAAAGITTGYDDGSFKPAQNLSRAHISAFLTRALIYEDVHNFNVNAFLQTVYANDNLHEQLSLLNEQQSQANTLLTKENNALSELLTQKKELESTITATQEQLKPLQVQIEGYHATISAANAEIVTYRANNKHHVYGTAKQKEHYLQTLEAMQVAYAKTQKEKEAALAKRDKLHTQYIKEQASLNQLRAAIQTKQQAINKQKETIAALKAATTTVSTKIATIEQQQQDEEQQRLLEEKQAQALKAGEEQQRLLEEKQAQAQKALEEQQKQWDEQQRLLEEKQAQAQKELEKQQKQWDEQQRALEQQLTQAQKAQEEQQRQQEQALENDIQHNTSTTEATTSIENEDFTEYETFMQLEESIIDANEFEEEVVVLVNEERAKEGLAPLEIDRALMAAAREKSQDMNDFDYFSHTSPTWGDPFSRLQALGITFSTAGENIARGQQTPEQVMSSWMNSPGHRANILNSSFTHIGVGFVQDGYFWTQQFIKK